MKHAFLTLLVSGSLPLAAAVTCHTDRILYQPGAAGEVRVTVAPGDPLPLTVEQIHGFGQVRALGTIAAAGDSAWAFTADHTWGGEIRVRHGDKALALDHYGVRAGVFDLAIMRGWPPDQPTWGTPEGAAAVAKRMDDEGVTGYESFFWGECDMFDFTPTEERFYGGQGGYPSTITGTKNVITAAHARGQIATFYANLWGGSGRPAMEVMRQHPRLFGNATYHAFILEHWDLLGPHWNMEDAQVRAPGVAWQFAQIGLDAPMPLFDAHADAIIATRRAFGWDAIRYDSYYTQEWTTRALPRVRARVAAAEPAMGWGFNSIIERDVEGRGLRDMVAGGGLIMGEDIRPERMKRLDAYLARMHQWREEIWAYGGHFGKIFNPGKRDLVAQSVWLGSALLAVGGHPYYQVLPDTPAQLNRFALRYSEILWDNQLRALAPDTQVVSGGEGFLHLPLLVRTRTLADGRHRLVVHLLNAPGTHEHDKPTGKTPLPPRTDVALRLAMPAGATAITAWNLRADPVPQAMALSPAVAGAAVTVTVPEVAWWNVVVVEWTGAALAQGPDLAARTAHDIQHWRVIGPFPSDAELTGFTTVQGPETAPGALSRDQRFTLEDGSERTWQPARAPTDAALGPHPLDFRTAVPMPTWNFGVGYAWTEITSDRERPATLRFKGDDTITVWWNGEQVGAQKGNAIEDQKEGVAEITLRAGTNRLLIKVVNKWMACLAHVRLADAAGDPITDGLTFWTRSDL